MATKQALLKILETKGRDKLIHRDTGKNKPWHSTNKPSEK